jgi:hypothetical protein
LLTCNTFPNGRVYALKNKNIFLTTANLFSFPIIISMLVKLP